MGMRAQAIGAGVATLVALAPGCKVRGIIGSNESSAIDGDGSSGTTGDGLVGTVTTDGSAGSTPAGETSSSTGDDSSTTLAAIVPLYDVAPVDDPTLCAPPPLPSCDEGDAPTWYEAMGMACDGSSKWTFSTASASGSTALEGAVGGPQSPFAPREGERMVVMSTGRAHEFAMTPQELEALHPGECFDPQLCPSADLGLPPRSVLPEPLEPRRVAADRDCEDDPSLIGTGDCSNTLADQWALGDGAYDYSELRLRAEVPPYTDAFEFDFAFFSSEYPLYTDHTDASPFNDMFVAWLESEQWTGNVSFDDEFHPITVQSVFLDFRSPSAACPDCEAPQLQGFSMEHHAGTRWLTTRAPVQTGEEIELVFALFDMTDGAFDSVVLLDRFEWSCSDGRPVTWAG